MTRKTRKKKSSRDDGKIDAIDYVKGAWKFEDRLKVYNDIKDSNHKDKYVTKQEFRGICAVILCLIPLVLMFLSIMGSMATYDESSDCNVVYHGFDKSNGNIIQNVDVIVKGGDIARMQSLKYQGYWEVGHYCNMNYQINHTIQMTFVTILGFVIFGVLIILLYAIFWWEE